MRKLGIEHLKYSKRTLSIVKLLFAILFLLISPVQGRAQVKEYSYQNINFIFTVHEDSTVDVVEEETFDFHGNFHNAFRNLSLNKVDDITDIEVADAETHIPVPFTLARESGGKKIEWHYDLTDTIHTWILTYKLHGAISFLKDHDELYWNLFTDFSVPIGNVTAQVILPKESDISNLQGTLYRTYPEGLDNFSQIINKKTIYFKAVNILPQEDVTIAAGWPKGIVSKTAYFKDAIWIWWPVVLSIVLVLGSIIFAFVYWYRTEKWRKGRGTIVPQYEPPQNLRPAIAEVLVKESISMKTWPATLIDLAVRGYVTIEEDKPSFFGWLGKNYIVKKKKEPDVDLQSFETAYLNILFEYQDYFSTKELKNAPSRSRGLYLRMKELEKDLYKEVDLDTNAYEKKVSKEKIFGSFAGVGFVIMWILLAFSSFIGELIGGKFLVLLLAILVSVGIIVWFLKFEARLSAEGAIMREDWLGFKLYLETAERYRMQNLTPEIFEKYLPYAMIFGIEKKWAKAFQSITMNPPTWYGVYGGYHTGTPGFSASAFSSSLSSSFSSAMGASGGSGASGGGGGAGGGGGGGGGGAS